MIERSWEDQEKTIAEIIGVDSDGELLSVDKKNVKYLCTIFTEQFNNALLFDRNRRF